MTTRYILHTSADLKNLGQIRDFVEVAVKGLDFEPELIHIVQLATDEVATNVTLHGYQRQGGPLEIELTRQKQDLVIYLRDQAPPFDPATVPTPDLTLPLADRPIGGLGVHLVRRTMDVMHHQVTAAGGNELTLIKHSAGSPKADKP